MQPLNAGLDRTTQPWRTRAAALLGVIAPLALAGAGASFAQPSASPSVARISQGFWDDHEKKTCANTILCQLTFAMIPAGKTVIASHANCSVVVANGARPSIDLGRKQDPLTVENAMHLPYTAGADSKTFIADVSALLIYLGGETPAVEVSLAALSPKTTIKADCSLGGTIKP
jgi:hypothetical protein